MPHRIARCLVALALIGASAARAEPDVIDRPARPTALGKSSALLSVTRAGKRLVAVGERGIVLLSDDSGSSWRQASVPVSESLTNVRFVNERQGWAIGHSGIILHSADGGQTWQRQLDGRKAADLCLTLARQVGEHAKAGDARAKGLLADAERLVADGPDKPFLDLWFKDANEGFVVGAYGLILGTSDGGQTWQSWQDRIDNPRGHHFYAISVVGDDILIAGEQGALFHSTNRGNSFDEVKTPYAGTYFGVRHLADGGVLAYGLRGSIYRSTSGLKDWQKVASGADSTLNGGASLDDGSLLLVDQSGHLLRSKDGGRSFQIASTRLGFPLTAVASAPDGAVIVVGLGGVARMAASTASAGAGK